MKVVLSWLRDYVDLGGIGVEELAERWTLAGLEVETIERIGDWWDRQRLLVGAVVRVEPHPNADRLVLADVDYGAGTPHRVVTGAPNLLGLRDGGDLPRPLKVAFAREGAELFDGHADGWVKTVLKGRPVRGVMSDAMVCSEKELGLSEDHDGILVLPDDAPVGAPLVEVLGDAVVDLDLTANYARAMNMVGVARETAAILGRDFQAPAPAVVAAGGDVAEWVEVVIQDPDLCPRYAARVIRDITVGPSPAWMARRLSLAGMRPISNVVDITNYVMLEWGEPLHAFDHDALVARAGRGRPTIIVRRARPGERMTTLDGMDRALDADTLMITDTAGPVAIAGVMGGAETEVTETTRHILLEAAAFEYLNIRRTSKLQKLPSESADRFGRGVHPALVEPGSARAAGLMAELAGGTVAAGVVDAYPRPPKPVQVRLDVPEVERLLGVAVPVEEIAAILQRLEFAVERQPAGDLRVTVPDHRMDVGAPADLVEEVARIYGYDRLPSTLLADPLPPQRDNPGLMLEEAIRDALVPAGLQEIISFRLIAVEREAAVWVDGRVDPGDYVTLANPISPERSALRRSILTGLLEAAARNRRLCERVALFELGPVFLKGGERLPEEPRRLGILMLGPAQLRSWRGRDERAADYYDVKGAVETLLEALGLRVDWRPGDHPAMQAGRTAALAIDDRLLGHAGELHPLVRERWELGDQPVGVADLDVEALAAAGAPALARPFAPFSAYPAVLRDLAVVVDEAVSAAEVEAVIRRAGGPLLLEVRLFDVYRGLQVGLGRKSLAWSLTFQSGQETLTGEVADALRGQVAQALAAELGGVVR